MSLEIHAIRTGLVKVKTAQRVRKPGGLIRVLTDSRWTEWLPIYAWMIDHPEGIIVVDTGETARTSQKGYFPWWNPYYRRAVRMKVRAEEEVGPQLRDMGIGQSDVRRLILTHFHTDHAGGLHHFPESEILVSGADLQLARSFMGRLFGYLPHRWPAWFDPEPIPFARNDFGPFDEVHRVTEAGDVLIVPTPGHTPNHVSVVVESEGVYYFLAGDTSYTDRLLLARTPDGVSPSPNVAVNTIDRILTLAGSRPLVYLPSHDPASLDGLKAKRTLNPPAGH